jgi:hypothetical protein
VSTVSCKDEVYYGKNRTQPIAALDRLKSGYRVSALASTFANREPIYAEGNLEYIIQDHGKT